MKLTSVRIKNFRSFRDVTVPLNNYTCLVGPNGTGKSTVIAALDVFFRHKATPSSSVTELQEEDFHQKNTRDPVEIILTFEGLSEEAQADFKDYFRQGRLIVFAKAIWSNDTKLAVVNQHGIRLGMARLKPYFAMAEEGASAKELKEEYKRLKAEFTNLPGVTSKDDMDEALHAFEAANPAKCEEIPSRDQFYGFTKGSNRLDKYVQWVHVPAVKDAADESAESRDTWLGQLLARAVRSKVKFDDDIDGIKKKAREQYDEMLRKQQTALADLSASLTQRMTLWASPDSQLALRWESDAQKAISVAPPFAKVLAGDGGFQGDLTRHGHGFQRSYLLALLQELAGASDGGPTLILACEEPELYQHPPQARHLASLFEQLSEKSTQVLVCTHSPLFVSGRAFEDVRLLRRKPRDTECGLWLTTFDKVSSRLTAAGMPGPRTGSAARARLHQALQATENEMFFSPVLVLVEGLSDAAYITAHLSLTNRLDEFRRLGCHIVPAWGKGFMPELLAVAKLIEIPTFAVFDADGHETRPDKRTQHEKENAAILFLSAGPGHPAMPTTDAWLPGTVQWKTELEDVIKAEVGKDPLEAAKNEVRKREGLVSESGLEKNGLYIGLVVEELAAKGKRCASLERLCEEIVKFARDLRPAPPAPPSPPALSAPQVPFA